MKIEVGQILKLKMVGTAGDHLVIEAGEKVSHDRVRGDSYYVFEFKTVKILPSGTATKVREWYLAGGSMRGHGLPVELDEVQIVGTASFKAVTTYTISKIKKAK